MTPVITSHCKKLGIIVPRDFRNALSRLVAEIARMHPVIHGLFAPDGISKSKRARIFGRHHRHRVNSRILSNPWRTIRSNCRNGSIRGQTFLNLIPVFLPSIAFEKYFSPLFDIKINPLPIFISLVHKSIKAQASALICFTYLASE